MRIIATLALLTFVVPLWAAEPFTEWPESQWKPMYDRALRHVTARRLLVGYPDCTIQPRRIATRYEWAAVLSRLVWYFDLELPEAEYLPPDVPWNHWCADACRILTASRLYPSPRGVKFCGDKRLTRGDFALTGWNLVQALRGVIPPKRLSDVGDPYRQAAQKLIEANILIKYADGKLHLERPVPRWQVCVAVHRLLVLNEKEGGPRLWGPVMYVPNWGGRRPEYR